MAPTYKVLVIGAGINGLSSAVHLQETFPNVGVTIIADKFSPNTTSDGAAGFWEVFACAKEDEELTTQLSRGTFDYLKQLASSSLSSVAGTFKIPGFQLKDEFMKEEFVFKDIVEGYRKLTPKDLEQFSYHDRIKDGRQFTSIVCESRPHLKWLTNRFVGNGGQFIKQKINSLSELSAEWDVVVNCTGLGSYHLLQDHEMVPIKGQVYRVYAPWIKMFYVLDTLDETTYILPNQNDIVVGGTFEKGNWNTEENKSDSKRIWERAVKLVPMLKGANILKTWVGLRPGRSRLRLEPEIIDVGDRKMRVVHNYGHGGAGLSIFYGCAKRVVAMVTQYIQEIEHSSAGINNSPVTKSMRSKL